MGKPLDKRQHKCYTVIEQRDCVTHTATAKSNEKFNSSTVFGQSAWDGKNSVMMNGIPYAIQFPGIAFNILLFIKESP